MTLEYRFSGRGKLVKGYTYPIKRGDLDVALERAGVTDLEYVSYTCYSGKVEKNLIISADMIGKSFHPGNWYKQSPDIGAYAVPTIISQRVKKLLIAQDVLNSLATWLKELEQAENVRRDQRQYCYVYFEDDALVIEHT
jgi:hypothetical protein